MSHNQKLKLINYVNILSSFGHV